MKTCAMEKQSSLSLHPLVPIPFLFLSESAYLKAYRHAVLGKKKRKKNHDTWLVFAHQNILLWCADTDLQKYNSKTAKETKFKTQVNI